MDAIAVARAGFTNVVASCGTSLAEPQIKLLGRFTRKVIVNYDPDTAGQAATERSLTLLLEKEFEVKVLALPAGADPDKFLKEQGADAYRKLLKETPQYIDYLIGRARKMDRSTAAGKVNALNFLMPYVQRNPSRLLRSEWATRIASELRVDEPVLRAELNRAAAERRSEVKPKSDLLAPVVKPAERQLIHMLVDAHEFRERIAQELIADAVHRGLECEKILDVLIAKVGEKPDPTVVAAALDDKDKRILFEILYETTSEPTWEEAQSCLGALRNGRDKRRLAELQQQIESKASPADLARLLAQRLELQKKLAQH